MFHFDELPGAEKDEKIVFYLRRHKFTLFKSIIGYVLLAIIPVFFYFVFAYSQPDAFSGPIAFPLVIIGATVYYLGMLAFTFNAFLDYYLDNWIITNHRIISIEQKNLFSRTVSEQALYRVQDVTAESRGIFATVFEYGTVFVQSAGQKERFVFPDVPKAFEVAGRIQELVQKDKDMHPGIS